MKVVFEIENSPLRKCAPEFEIERDEVIASILEKIENKIIDIPCVPNNEMSIFLRLLKMYMVLQKTKPNGLMIME